MAMAIEHNIQQKKWRLFIHWSLLTQHKLNDFTFYPLTLNYPFDGKYFYRRHGIWKNETFEGEMAFAVQNSKEMGIGHLKVGRKPH
jgi:hypothetical protein